MSFAMTGITHCRECWTPLKEHEYGLCENCRKKEKEKNKKRGKKMSKKIYKGYELLKAIADGEVKERK